MIHYGWYIVMAGNLCVLACLGIGRFSFGMLLPSMGEALGLSYAQMGLISTLNFAGYLVAVVLIIALNSFFGRLAQAQGLSASFLLAEVMACVAVVLSWMLPRDRAEG